jgi:rhodanese-related sulfurtransferase
MAILKNPKKINLITLLSLAGVLLLLFNPCALAHTNVTVQQARELIDSTNNLTIVDVREAFEYCDLRGHIPGALNYPWNSGVLQARYEELPMNNPILVVCQSGGRSNQAANFLDSKGFSMVYDMLSGMNAWTWETAPCKYSGGSGTAVDPYQIATAEDLILLGENPEDYDKHFILTADIDLDPNLPGRKVFDKAVIGWEEINVRAEGFAGTSFTGCFDGQGHVIRNLKIHGQDYLGLFGYLDSEAVVVNLGLEAVDVNGTSGYVGGLVGQNIRSYISLCYSTGKVNGAGYVGGLAGTNSGNISSSYSTAVVNGVSDIGGLVGINYSDFYDMNVGIITASYSTGTVRGSVKVGGLVGDNSGGIINVCYSTSMVTGSKDVGGLVGANSESTINNCYSTGTASGNEVVGGLVGVNINGSISSCYSTGIVSGVQDVGGLVGISLTGNPRLGGGFSSNTAIVTDSFWDEESSGQDTSAGGTGLTTTQMQDINTYLDAGWDFINETTNGTSDFWLLQEGAYPIPAVFSGIIPIEPQGAGLPEDPYLITNAKELSSIWYRPMAHYRLTADIDLSGITRNLAIVPWFGGSLDGNDFSIRSIHIQGLNLLGIFGVIEPSAKVTNLGLEDVSIEGTGDYIGGLAGLNLGSVSSSHSTGIISGEDWIGGLVGYNEGHFTACYSNSEVNGNNFIGGLVGENWGNINIGYSTGTVRGHYYVGGLIGSNVYSNINSSYSTSPVGGDREVGGLVGDNIGNITMSYSGGAVSGVEDVGGLVGNNWGGITMSYSTGMVTGENDFGGLVGYNFYGNNIASSFWDMETSGVTNMCGHQSNNSTVCNNSFGKTTAEMQDINTYLNAGWDFVDEILNGTCDYWQISPGDYPRLHYQAGVGPTMPEGLGTKEEPYLIRDALDLGTVWFEPLAHYRLEESVDLSGITWSMAIIPFFGGTFDGNSHIISNLNIRGGGYLGLFGQSEPEAKISNVRLEAVEVNGTGYYIGGLIGYNTGKLSNSCCTGLVSGDNNIGGIAGYNNGHITMCYSTGSVNGTTEVGGLAGESEWDSYITDSYSNCSVSGNENVGGLAGYNYYGNIYTSYSTGVVIGNENAGGLVGNNRGNDRIILSFWDVETSGLMNMSGNQENTTSYDDYFGKITVEMQSADTFLIWGIYSNELIWTIDDGNDYPRLLWEDKPGELIASTLPETLAGEGTDDNPYLIYTSEQFNRIGLFQCEWDKHFKLMADIDLSGFDGREGRPEFNIIAPGINTIIPEFLRASFSGVFDGNGHTISNFCCYSDYADYVGLFGCVDGPNAQIINLGLINPKVEVAAGENVGSLVGRLLKGSVTNCFVEGGTVTGVNNVGGLVGYNFQGQITYCHSTATVSGEQNVGGLVGLNEGTVSNSCVNGGFVSGESTIGGLVGMTYGVLAESWASVDVSGRDYIAGLAGAAEGSVSNCYAKGDALGRWYIGGLVGFNFSAEILDCYSTGSSHGDSRVGGLIGRNFKGIISACFWDKDTSGLMNICGNQGDEATGCDDNYGKTSAEMQTAATFLEAGWDFVDETENGTEDIWWIYEGVDYPHLWWELVDELVD